MIIELKNGKVEIELYTDAAPNHVKQITTLANNKEYDGVVFHRVIDGFMAQTGDVEFGNSNKPSYDINRAGTGGSNLPDLKAEFSNIPHEKGTLSMARSNNPNSANSQFFIMFADGHFLNGQYTVFGTVSSGMEYVDKIKLGDQANNGSVNEPDQMLKVLVS